MFLLEFTIFTNAKRQHSFGCYKKIKSSIYNGSPPSFGFQGKCSKRTVQSSRILVLSFNVTHYQQYSYSLRARASEVLRSPSVLSSFQIFILSNEATTYSHISLHCQDSHVILTKQKQETSEIETFQDVRRAPADALIYEACYVLNIGTHNGHAV